MQGEFRYPSSFRRLLSAGLVLVALPLILALVGSVFSIRKLSEQGIHAVYQAQLATQASRQLAENLDAQERAARQYLVLGDSALWQAYDELHAHFAQVAGQFEQAIPSDVQYQQLQGMMAAEDHLYQLIKTRHSEGTGANDRRWREAVVDRFAGLAEASRALVAQNSLTIEHEIDALREQSILAERTAIVVLVTLLPTMILLIVSFTRLLARPITQIEAAIEGLRESRLERPIAVDGPLDLKNVGTELDRLRLRLIELEEQKSRFLRHISHELKTPLTVLREGTDLLSEGAAGTLQPAQAEIVGILRENSLRLRTRIEDLLNYSAAEFEQSALQRQYFPLRELVEAVVDCQRLAAQARALTIELQIGDLVINADRERLRAVLDNLLSNAIKYSPDGGTITMTARSEDRQVVIEVADQGEGISDHDRPHVFAPFYQGRRPVAGTVKGSGLGLSIARDHVLAHGGSLSLIDGPGARFVVRLPLQ